MNMYIVIGNEVISAAGVTLLVRPCPDGGYEFLHPVSGNRLAWAPDAGSAWQVIRAYVEGAKNRPLPLTADRVCGD